MTTHTEAIVPQAIESRTAWMGAELAHGGFGRLLLRSGHVETLLGGYRP